MTSSVIKHFTASGLISDSRGRFLLHLHPKLGIWLPPGGNIDMVYWCRPLREYVAVHPEFHWLTPDEISSMDNVPQDVCGLIAMIHFRL